MNNIDINKDNFTFWSNKTERKTLLEQVTEYLLTNGS